MFLLNFIFFVILLFLVIYLPGRLLLRFLGFSFQSFLITFTASLVSGLASFLFFVYLLSFLKIPFLYNIIIPIVFVLEIKNTFKEFKKNISLKNFLTFEALIVSIGTLIMAFTTWNSGFIKQGEMLFYGVNGQDSVYHMALIGSLVSNFPPMHPGLFGVPLRGYNFFYDFLISNFAQFYHLNTFDLFFRFFSLFISLLLGLASLSLSKFLNFKKFTSFLFIFLIYFVQSFDFFAYYVFRSFNYYYNSSGITQSLDNALDPSIVLSASFIFVGFILLFSKWKKFSFLLPVLIIGVIPQIKIYAGIIFYSGFTLVVLWELYKNRNLKLLATFILSGIVSAVVYLPINYGAGGLLFAPLLIYKNFIDSAWIFNNWHWNVNFPLYVSSRNYIHLAFFYAVAISIFFLTSLGVRIFVVIGIKKVFEKKTFFSKNIFWIGAILSSFFIPSFFIQSVSGFSIIQFFWVGYILLLIPTAFVIGERMEKAKLRYRIITVFVLILLFLPSVINLLRVYGTNPGIINSDLVRQAAIIRNIPEREGVVLADRVLIKDKFEDINGSPIISALSARPVYYEHELTAFSGLDKVTDVRKEHVENIYRNMINCTNPNSSEENIIDTMKKSGNKYLLIFSKNLCTIQFKRLKVVDEGKYSVLYKI